MRFSEERKADNYIWFNEINKTTINVDWAWKSKSKYETTNRKKKPNTSISEPSVSLLGDGMEWVSEWKRRESTRWQQDNNKNNRKRPTFCYKFFGLATAATVTIHFLHHNLSFDWNKRMDLMKSFSLTLMFTLTTFAIYAIFTVHYRHTHAFTRRSTQPPPLSLSITLLLLQPRPLFPVLTSSTSHLIIFSLKFLDYR